MIFLDCVSASISGDFCRKNGKHGKSQTCCIVYKNIYYRDIRGIAEKRKSATKKTSIFHRFLAPKRPKNGRKREFAPKTAKKSLRGPCPGTYLAPRDRFLSILGSRPAPKLVRKQDAKNDQFFGPKKPLCLI